MKYYPCKKNKTRQRSYIGDLHYLLNTEGDKKLSQDREKFQEWFNLTDADMEELSQLAYKDYIDEIDRSEYEEMIKKILFNKNKRLGGRRTNGDDIYEELEKYLMDWWKGEKFYRREEILYRDESGPSEYGEGYCKVFATQCPPPEEAKKPDQACDARIALPDIYIKNAYNNDYIDPPWDTMYNEPTSTVDIIIENEDGTIKEKLYDIEVKEAGPKYHHDNYWTIPKYRREFKHLNQCVPKKQEEHNEGLCDKNGNRILPSGIDLRYDQAKKLGLEKNKNAWIHVNMSRLPGFREIGIEVPDFFQPKLIEGSLGESVTIVQRILKCLGYNVGVIDGIYGEITEKAVKYFQRDQGLKVDGKVGSNTWKKLTQYFDECGINKIMCY